MPEINFFWDPLSDNILQERDETGAVTAEYTAEPGLYGNIVSQNRGGVEGQFHYDAQGSTLAVTDDNQNVTDTFAYTAFGEVTGRTGTTEVPFQYIGQKGYYTDSLTGQIMARQRPYEPARIRWLSVEPLGTTLAELNGYLYVGNSPLTAADPTGLTRESDCDATDKDRKLTCSEFLSYVTSHSKFLTELHSSLETILKCHVDIYCGKCSGFDGLTWVDPLSARPRWGHICLNEKLENTLFYWVGLLIHEAFHFIQFNNSSDRPKPCPGDPFGGTRGPEPTPGGGTPTRRTCDTCKDKERRAYLHQAQFHFPGPKCEDLREIFIEWGLARSCSAACKGIEVWDIEGKWAKFQAALKDAKASGCEPREVSWPETEK